MTFPLYHYKATALRVIDGDSAWLRIDRGFREFWEISCRLAFINAPELSTGDPGARAKLFLYGCLFANPGTDGVAPKPLWVRSEKMDVYGRPLVTIWTQESTLHVESINAQMLMEGHAVAYGSPPK